MKKLLLLVVLMLMPICAFAAGLSMFNPAYSTGNIFNQAVGNSGTSWTLLTATAKQLVDSYGNAYVPSAYQIIPADGASDFSYAYTSNPSAWVTWRGVYGPFQNVSNFPSNSGGIYICTTPGAGTVTFQIECK